eukprot:m.293050 g.293050  ORF g.293050 m.293050 type:complete len:220 (-) comp18217_c0_seq1:68-727(-)
MLALLSTIAAVLVVAKAQEPGVIFATFDGANGTTLVWTAVNDPVMGGVSNSKFSVNETIRSLVWNGEVKIVPSLKAPGFANLENVGLRRFPDASAYTHILIHADLGEYYNYSGYKFSFAADTLNPQFKSFKADFPAVKGSGFTTIAIPFTKFSNDWSSFTGECSTKDPTGYQHHCCTPEHPEVCVTPKNLKDIEQLGVWAEGVAGKFSIKILWIGAGNA